ncbi:MAG: hypothetical protein ACFFDI_21995 [Promethearchaeota archaeon]
MVGIVSNVVPILQIVLMKHLSKMFVRELDYGTKCDRCDSYALDKYKTIICDERYRKYEGAYHWIKCGDYF